MYMHGRGIRIYYSELQLLYINLQYTAAKLFCGSTYDCASRLEMFLHGVCYLSISTKKHACMSALVQFSCYQHRQKWISSSHIHIRLSLEVTCNNWANHYMPRNRVVAAGILKALPVRMRRVHKFASLSEVSALSNFRGSEKLSSVRQHESPWSPHYIARSLLSKPSQCRWSLYHD